MTRAVIISNPNASRADAGKLGQAIARLRAGGLTVDVAATREAGHGAELARAALDDGAELLIANGGDGTIMEIASVVAGTGRPIGLLPAGTGNRLADNLRIPWGPVAAAETILTMQPRAIDIGRLEAPDMAPRYFAVAGGCGFDAEVMFRTTTSAKRAWGSGAYFATAVRLALAMPRSHVRVEVDGVAIEREAVMVLLANCGTILPIGRTLSPHIALDDGLLDVIVLNARGFFGAWRMAYALAFENSRHPDIEIVRGRLVKIEAEPGMAVQGDGELCGRTPLTAELLVGGLTVLAPRAR